MPFLKFYLLENRYLVDFGYEKRLIIIINNKKLIKFK